MNESPWYGAGLRFSCRRCGSCCTGAPGYVWVNTGETDALAGRFGLTPAAFLARHARQIAGRWSLREEADGRCILYEPGAGCTVYDARPRQCRTWPFWPGIVAERRTWEAEAADCPGMGSGELFERERIEALARQPERGKLGGSR